MPRFLYRCLLPGALALALAACGDSPEPPQERPVTDTTQPDETITEPLADRAMVEDGNVEVVDEAAPDAAATADDEGGTLVAEEMVDDEPAPATGPGVIHLAQGAGGSSSAGRESRYREGTHYQRLSPAQPTAGSGSRVEVLDVFWYGCPACYQFEPLMRDFADNLPDGVEVVKIPVGWDSTRQLHARAFYAARELDRLDDLHPEIFRAYHERNNRLQNEDSIRRLFRDNGVSGDEFDQVWHRNMAVDSAVRRATQLTRAGGRYNVRGTPTVVINGKYVVTPDRRAQIGLNDLINITEELVQRELDER